MITTSANKFLLAFLRTVIKLNYPGASSVHIQLLSVPPNVFAWGWAMIMAYVAMRYKQHAYVAMLGGLFSTVSLGFGGALTASPFTALARLISRPISLSDWLCHVGGNRLDLHQGSLCCCLPQQRIWLLRPPDCEHRPE